MLFVSLAHKTFSHSTTTETDLTAQTLRFNRYDVSWARISSWGVASSAFFYGVQI